MRSIAKFLACVRTVVDTLMSIGDLILKALPTEFDSVVVAVNLRLDFISLDELESLLFTQEARINKMKKEVYETVSVNLTQGSLQPQTPPSSEISYPN